MQFRVTIDMDNDAFAGDAAPGELTRILRSVAEEIESVQSVPRLGYACDVSGNKVCTFRAVD